MDGSIWRPVEQMISDAGRYVMSIDLPGHGATDNPALRSIRKMADWVASYLDPDRLSPAHVVGHSMGALIALELAAHHPKVVRSLTLCGVADTMPVNPDLLLAAENDLSSAAAMMAKWGHAKQFVSTDSPLVADTRALIERSRAGVLAIDLQACANYADAPTAAKAIDCPTTVFIALADRMTPPSAGRALASALPKSRIVELAEAGHLMIVEQPRAIADSILESVG